MPLFQPKHQKLILQCYPPGAGPDKKPNSSELSYLLYYASSRRVKLEKIGKFLQKKNDVDVHRNRAGNVQVTLEIINSLIGTCPDDINVLAQNITHILQSVFKTKDLALLQHAGPVFNTFCETLDGELFSGDVSFVETFTRLSDSFLGLSSNNNGLHGSEWTALSLKAASSIAHCKNIAKRNGDYLVKKAIPLLLTEIKNDITEENLIRRVNSHGSEQTHDLARSASKVLSRVHDDKAPPSPKEINLEQLAIQSLKAYFTSTSSIQLISSSREVSNYFVKTKTDLKWSAALIEVIATWIPVQLRFIILSVFTNSLDKHGDSREQLIYLHSITGLLSSSVNLIGLSAIDNLRQFSSLQKYSVLNSSEPNLVNAYTNAIGSLANHIYYKDQITDLVAELLAKLKEANTRTLISTIIDDLLQVLKVANTKDTIQRASVPLEIFIETFDLLAHADPTIQSKYINLLQEELALEYKNKPEYSKPNHQELIKHAEGSVLSELFESFESIQSITDYSQFISLIESIFDIFGINALVNFFPFFYHWQLNDENDSNQQKAFLDNIGFVAVYIGSKALEYDFLADVILSRIDYRKQSNIWVLNDFPSDSSHQVSEFALSKDYVTSIISENGYPLDDFKEILFNSHYKYSRVVNNDGDYEDLTDLPDQSVLSGNHSQDISLTMLVQPPSFNNGDLSSIRSAPLSVRSILAGKLNVPKVHELREAISGTTLNKRVQSKVSQRNDIGSLLNDLDLDSELDNKGALSGY